MSSSMAAAAPGADTHTHTPSESPHNPLASISMDLSTYNLRRGEYGHVGDVAVMPTLTEPKPTELGMRKHATVQYKPPRKKPPKKVPPALGGA